MALEDTLLAEAGMDDSTGELVQPRRSLNRSRPRTFELSDDAEMQLKEMARSARPAQSSPVSQPKPGKPLGLMGTIKEGAKGTLRMLGATADTMQGDAQGVVQAAQDQATAPKDPDLKRFYEHIEEQKKALGENPSLWEGIKAVGSAALETPRGFGLMVAEQLPNSGAALGMAGAGALAGSFGGPVGMAVGGLAGLATANIGLETGAKALEAAQDQNFSPEEQSRVRREGLTKGSVITGVDAVTIGLTKFITNASRRAVEAATIKTLTDNGVDVTSAAARKTAMETPEIAEAVKAAQETARQGAETLGKRIARTGGAVALETIGEGAGEFLGELAATGKANAIDAVIEGFAGMGTSIGQITAIAAMNRKALNRLLDTQEEAQKKAQKETRETGVEHEVIPHPTEPDKFAAVPKVRSVAGIELERDAQGNLRPKTPVSTQADFNLANRQGFELTAEDKIRQREIGRQREEALARNPIIIPGADKSATPTIAGKPVTQLPIEALNYTVNRGSTRSREIAARELERRQKEGDTSIPEKPEDTVTRIVATGAEKAQEDAKKARSILTPSQAQNVQPAAPMPAATSMSAANLQVVLPDNTSLPAQWDVVDADSIKATIREGKNQPRDRSRAASDIQVQGIASNPDYRRLADSPVMDVGSPTLSADGLIVGGNGRFEGISRAYDQGSASEYLANLKADAAAKGIDPAKIEGMKKPVLVRRITKPFDVRKLAIASNSGTGLQYSGLELAKIDAERMQNLENLEITDSGDIALTSSNIPNIRNALSGYSAAELGSLVDKDGVLSQEGVRRLRNAIIYQAYGASPTLERLVESTDNDLRNISGALVRAAPAAAKAKADIKAGRLPAELDISEQLTGALETLSKIRAQGQNVDEYLSQSGLFGEEINEDTKAILRVLDANIRSQKKIADFIRTYYDSVSNIDTSTDDIFGAPQPKKPDLIKNAKERITDRHPQSQDLFARPAGSTRAESSKQSPDNGGTSKSSEKDQQVKKEEAKTPETPKKPAPAKEQSKPAPEKPAEAKPQAPDIRSLVESLIKRRAAAKQTGKERSVNNAIQRAKDILDGKRTDSALESKWFRVQAAAIRRTDPETADILGKISEAVKANEQKQKTETSKPAVAMRGDQKPVPRGGRILANGIAETIRKNGVAALVGQKIASPERLAELAQVYRNPQYETFRIFFTKGSKIVHASGVTARLPGATPIFPKDMDFNQGVNWIKGMMESSGADGYWMLHNHPSGNPTPSNGDMKATANLASSLPGFKGHVVINSNKYSQITVSRGSLKAEVVTKDFGEDKLLQASKPHEYLGRMVPSSDAVVSIGKSFQKEGWITLIGVSGVSGVRAIAEIPLKTFTTPMLARAAIRRFGRKSGAESVFAYGKESDLKAGNAAALTREGFLRSAVNEEGRTHGIGNPTRISFGRESGTGGMEVQQTPAAFKPLKDRFDKITDSLIYNFQDRFKPLKDIQKRAGPVAEDEDAALAEERYSGTVRARLDNFEDQLRDPLLKAIHDSGVAYEDVEKYLHALHAPSRNAAMKEINPTEGELKTQISTLENQRDTLAKDADVKRFIELRRELRQAEADIEDGIADESLARGLKSDIAQIRQNQSVKDYAEALDKLKGLRLVKPFKGDNAALSGMSDKEAADILAKADKDGTRAKLDKVSALVDSITQSTRQIYVDSGLEKADAINAWNQKYQHYVPLHRDEVGGNTMPKVGQGFNIRGKESKRATGSTKEVVDILAHVVAQHEAAIIRSEKARVDRALFQFASTHPDPSLWTLDNAPMLRTVDPVTGFVVERVDPTYKNRPEVLTLKIDGEEHTITFDTQNPEAMRLAASMKNLSSQEMGEVTQMVGRFTRFLATMNTTANPVFTARNFMRDLQTAYVNLSDTAIADKKREVFRDVPSAIKGMWAMARGKKNSQWAKYAQEFKAAGGQTGWMDHYKDIGSRADALRKELEVMKPGRLNAARRTWKSWVDIVNDANNAVENGARLAAFVNARRSGLSEAKAAQLAKNLTVNFNAKGAKSVELNAWYMFMNASIQGTARLIKAMSNRQVRKIVAGIVLSGFLMDVLARAMAGDDDEDGENDYDQLPEHTKAMNFVLMVGGQPVTVPMPYGYNFFASAGRKVSEMIFRENYSPVKSATDLASIFLDAFSPVGQAGSGLQFVAPTVADPFVQWAENKNFAGNPLRKDQSTFGVPKPEYQMGFKSTSAPGKWLAEALNNATGGNEVRPGFVNVNPTFFDFVVSSIAGGAGRTYLQTFSGPVKALGDDEVKAREVPFLNIFVGARPEYQTERKYFEAVGEVELAQKELTTYREKGDVEMVRQIREEHRAALRMSEAAKITKELLTRLRKRDLALDKADPENKRELRRELEEKKREAMSRFNRKYKEAIDAEG